ncbi:ferritin-like domain-containing protein [Aridibaculum aurantiacum]|uniref:YciE/YciF ferroxidase family protein n=1 Tax=Aridibaculum aurantiacum TaxID=2810307 RepID=UPI001A97B7D0|nr:DUF892 family protein [Aridibaculum aurantiacum]
MKDINDLQDLLIHLVTQMRSAEVQSQEAIPQIIEKANHRSLKNALQHHHQQTGEQVKRLEKILRVLESDGNKETVCKGMQGLIQEATEIIGSPISKDAIDPAIIFSVQKMEHYEICSYGTAVAYAQQLHLHEVEQMLLETLNEEYDADDLLTALATSGYNKEAAPPDVEESNFEKEATVNNSGETTPSTTGKVVINERTIQSPGGRAGRSHRGYSSGESRGH